LRLTPKEERNPEKNPLPPDPTEPPYVNNETKVRLSNAICVAIQAHETGARQYVFDVNLPEAQDIEYEEYLVEKQRSYKSVTAYEFLSVNGPYIRYKLGEPKHVKNNRILDGGGDKFDYVCDDGIYEVIIQDAGSNISLTVTPLKCVVCDNCGSRVVCR
jgi:hypothetical protein